MHIPIGDTVDVRDAIEHEARFDSTLERDGAVPKDAYYNIGVIAVDPLTAWDLYDRGLLPLAADELPEFKAVITARVSKRYS